MTTVPRALSVALMLALGSCGTGQHNGNLQVSVIGTGLRRADPDQSVLTPPQAMLNQATAAGLVALDANGLVEPALAESWIVTSDGLSTIFRLRRAKWPGGGEVSARDVAASLNRALSAGSRNPLKPILRAVDTVVAMTDRVVEIRLKAPRPYLLQLLAQPELGIRRNGVGIGPYIASPLPPNSLRLRAIANEDDPQDTKPFEIMLHAETTSRAVARFLLDRSDLVSGGTFADWPVVTVAAPRAGRLRIDPVQGLFGLAIVGRTPFLADGDVRVALAEAVDRKGLASTIGLNGWVTQEGALPAQLDSASLPTQPDWAVAPMAQRRADAAARIAAWAHATRLVPTLRVALPAGPGMRVLFARLTADWSAIGVSAVVVPPGTPEADLRLIDAVAPNASANWFLTTLSCAAGLICEANGDFALDASRAATTLEARSARIADADLALVTRGSYIAIGVPLRWSLVDPSLTGWHENVFGAHPLAELRPLPVGG